MFKLILLIKFGRFLVIIYSDTFSDFLFFSFLLLEKRIMYVLVFLIVSHRSLSHCYFSSFALPSSQTV